MQALSAMPCPSPTVAAVGHCCTMSELTIHSIIMVQLFHAELTQQLKIRAAQFDMTIQEFVVPWLEAALRNGKGKKP